MSVTITTDITDHHRPGGAVLSVGSFKELLCKYGMYGSRWYQEMPGPDLLIDLAEMSKIGWFQDHKVGLNPDCAIVLHPG